MGPVSSPLPLLMVITDTSPYDNLSSKQCHGKPLPCSVNDTSLCVSQDDADAIYRLGNWEWAYRFRHGPHALRLSALRMGAWVRELLGHIQDIIEGRSPVKYFHKCVMAVAGYLLADRA